MKTAALSLLASCVGYAVAQSSVCTNVDNSGQKASCLSNDGTTYNFDLSCVQAPQGLGADPYFSGLAEDGSGYIYYFNFQGLPTTIPFGRCTLPSDQVQGNVAAQATSDGNFCYAIGTSNTGAWSMNSNLGSVSEFLKITYSAYGRNMELDVYCDPTAEVPVYDPVGEDLSAGLYVLHVTTKWACKQFAGQCTGGGAPVAPPRKGGPGGALFGLFVGFSAIYFVGGYAFLRFSKLKEGNDRVPHYTFWTSLPGLVKDGWSFTKGKVGGGGNDSYASV